MTRGELIRKVSKDIGPFAAGRALMALEEVLGLKFDALLSGQSVVVQTADLEQLADGAE